MNTKEMRVAFEKMRFNEVNFHILIGNNPLDYALVLFSRGWQAALSQPKCSCDGSGLVHSPDGQFLGTCDEHHVSQQPVQPSSDPVAWRLDWPAEISLGMNKFVGFDNPGHKDRSVSLGATAIPLYAAPPDYEALRAENAKYKKILDGIPEDAFWGGWTARGISNALISAEAERDVLKARNDDLEPAFAKASKACSSALLALAHTSLDNPLYSDAYEEVNAMMPIFMELRK